MNQAITRLYANAHVAEAAVQELKKEGFGDERIYCIAASPGKGEDELRTEIMRAYVPYEDAKHYAPRIAAGAVLVTVHAVFGQGSAAIRALDRHESVDVKPAVQRPVGGTGYWDEAAPLSSALQMPTLFRFAAPFSEVIGIPTLTKSSPSSGRSSVSRRPKTTSESFGLPLLSKPKPSSGRGPMPHNPAPFSRMIGLPLLTKGRKR